MFMFNLFRQSKRITKSILWVVILAVAGGMLLFFVPTPGDRLTGGRGSDDIIARVDDMTVPTRDFVVALNRYREQFSKYNQGGDMSFLKSLKIEQRALDELVKERVIEAEAERMGLKATEQEIADQIQKYPGLSVDGKFIGKDALLRVLRFSNPPMTFQDLENATRASILREKLNRLLTDSATVTPEEVKQEWLKNNEKATIEYVLFDPKELENEVTAGDAELADYFNKNKDKYKTGEERKVKLVFIDQNTAAKNVQISEQEMRDYFEKNLAREEARVSHILFKTENKSDQEVEEIRKKAEGVLKEVRAGADFGALAEKYSEDEGSAKNKGELPPSPREAWVPEFAQAAFSMNPGQISDLVKTQYGFHIIKLLEKKTPRIEDHKQQIETTLRLNKNQEGAKQLADKVENDWKQSKDIDKAAKENGLTVTETPYFKNNVTTLPGLKGGARALANKVFQLSKAGEATAPIRLVGGYALAQLVDIKPPAAPELSAVRSKVETDYKKAKAEDLAASKANELAKAVEASKNLEQAAKQFKLSVTTSSEFTRAASIDNTVGYAPEIAEKAFTMKIGEVSGAMTVPTGNKKIIFQVKAHTEFDKAQFEKDKAALEDQLLSAKKGNLFYAYINSLTEKMKKEKKIVINQDVFKRYTL
jgi:peptidyl-prolyl cis-trans isomerase D